MGMRDDDGDHRWGSRWQEELLPSPEELMPMGQTLITPHLALAFDIRSPIPAAKGFMNISTPVMPSPPVSVATPSSSNTVVGSSQPNSAELGTDSAEFGSGSAGDEPARTLKRPRLVWTPQLHKRFVDAVAHLGIKNAVPKTIMQLMSVEGLTRENVASHLQKYRLYLKRMQGLSAGGPPGGGNGHAGAAAGAGVAGVGFGTVGDSSADHLFATSPVPAHFLHHGRPNSDHLSSFLSLQPLHQPHHQIAAAGALGHPQYRNHCHGHVAQLRPPQSGQLDHPFLPAHHPSQPVNRVGLPFQHIAPAYADDFDSVNFNAGRKVLTLFPMRDD